MSFFKLQLFSAKLLAMLHPTSVAESPGLPYIFYEFFSTQITCSAKVF